MELPERVEGYFLRAEELLGPGALRSQSQTIEVALILAIADLIEHLMTVPLP